MRTPPPFAATPTPLRSRPPLLALGFKKSKHLAYMQWNRETFRRHGEQMFADDYAAKATDLSPAAFSAFLDAQKQSILAAPSSSSMPRSAFATALLATETLLDTTSDDIDASVILELDEEDYGAPVVDESGEEGSEADEDDEDEDDGDDGEDDAEDERPAQRQRL